MKKRILSALLTLALTLTLLPVFTAPAMAAGSITEQEVVDKLNELKDGKYKPGTQYSSSGECLGFAVDVFNDVFGTSLKKNSYSNARFPSTNTANLEEIGHLGANYTSADLAELLKKAKPGDMLLVADTGKSYGHAMIIWSVDSAGQPTVYDANSSWANSKYGMSKNAIAIHEYKASLASQYHPGAATLYRYTGYSGPSAIYTISPKCAPDSCLDIQSQSTANGANVQIWKNYESQNQQFQFVSVGDGWYKIVPQHSQRALDCASQGTTAGTNVQQYDYSPNHNSQKWKLEDAGDGYYYIIPKGNTDLCLDVASGSSKDGTNVQIYTRSGSDAQKWKLTLVSGVPDPDFPPNPEPQTLTVTFDPNGGTGSKTTRTYTYGNGEKLGSLPTTSRVGYTLAGWSTAGPGESSGLAVSPDTLIDWIAPGENSATLYAGWNNNKYVLSFDANGGSVSVTSKEIYYGSLYGGIRGDFPTPTRDGYEFVGWYTSASGGSRITSDTEVTTAADHTLYAHWEATDPTGGRLPFVYVQDYRAGTFSDIGFGEWYDGNVISVYRLGLMRGVGDNRFAPDDNVTLAEAVTMAARIHNTYYQNNEKFEAYDGGNWYDPYVNYIKRNGLLAENYDYNRPATREQFAHILACAFPDEALAPLRTSAPSFVDAGSIVYRGDVNRLYIAGVINGSLDGGVLSFKPQDTITRAEAAAIVTRMAQPALRIS